ncbi:transketolase [Xylophilus rhododendri]|uniref:Transketolase n=1 Tax=Xylophilus rhododendri TaxID=2697032 RepID=A0A857J8F8_9BURK|nr:transketolase [Xylophilus rhododendri]QHJ00157.1 transketolase [Xylophilus rhododendri]
MQDTLQDPARTGGRFDPAQLRKTVLDMAFAGSTVHIGCAFSLIEILAVLYRKHLRYPGNDPRAALRDYLVLSKGHGVMAQYACMYEMGWLQRQDIDRYFADGSDLKGLSDSRIPGLEVTSGSLGHGFSVGVGLALGAKLRKTDQKVYVIVGDGEINEGPIWEGMLFAAHHGLDNLVVIIDENGFQAMGKTEDVLRLGNLQAKFDSFDFDAVNVDGHDEDALDAAIGSLLANGSGKPKAIVAKTVKGRGVGFMEHDNIWHYTRLNDKTYADAVAALGEKL